MSDLLKVKVGGSSYLCKWTDPIQVQYNLLSDIPGHSNHPTAVISGQTWSIIPSSNSYTEYTFSKAELIGTSESSFRYVEIEFDKYVKTFTSGANGMTLGSGCSAYRNHSIYPDRDVIFVIFSNSVLTVDELFNGASTYDAGDSIIVLGKSGKAGYARNEKYILRNGTIEVYTDGDLMAIINNPNVITGPLINAWNETGTNGVCIRNLKIKCEV